MKRFSITIAAAALLLLVLFANASAQTGEGGLTGTVEDPGKALIPGVTITATNTQTGVETRAVTNESGGYNIPGLLPGLYKLTADLPGFRTVSFNNIDLGTNETKRFNFTLEVASQNTVVDVIDASALLTTSSASIDQALPEYRVRDLPLVGNNVLDLIGVLGGARVSAFGGDLTTFAGISAGYVNTTVNGQSVNDGRYEAGVYSTTRINPDMVSEVRLVLTPVDAEMGRGNGQVQIQTRSGTNQYRGSAVWNLRNTALDARSWFDNRTTPLPTRTWTNQNQYTLSYGGPIKKNKTFFFVLYDGQETRLRNSAASLVLSDCARNGIFRYFPDWNNGNINQNPTPTPTALGSAAIPVVDALGNPKAPATFRNGNPYTGTLQYYSVFGRLQTPPTKPDCSDAQVTPNTAWDQFGRTPDTTGFIAKTMALMPHANSFDGGDGLNTANYRYAQRQSGNDGVSGGTGDQTNRKQINIRIDHNFSVRHKLGANWSNEWDASQTSPPDWPSGFWGSVERHPQVVTTNFISTLSSTLVNEARFGVRYNSGKQYAAPDDPTSGTAAGNFNPKINGIPVVIAPSLFNNGVMSAGDFTRGNVTSLWTYGDTLSWTKGQHAFKFGAEVRPTESDGFSNLNMLPHATGGAGGGSVNFPDFTTALPAGSGMLATNSTTMGNLLGFHSGSVGSLTQLYFVTSPDRLAKFDDIRTANRRGTDVLETEWSAFFKDDWKASRNLTLNLGLRYEYYGTPHDAHGLTLSPVGGGLAAFGYSGRSFTDWFHQGQGVGGDPLTFEFVGPHTPNPGKSLWKADADNFGPAVGFAWQLPWFGQGKTTVRGGYQITYQGGGRSFNFDLDSGYAPGMIFTPSLNAADNTFVRLADIQNPGNCGGAGCIPVPHNIKPMQPIPNEYRATIAGWSGVVYDPHYVDPYIQNFTLAVTRSVGRNMTVDVRYIGTRGVKLYDTLPLNSRNFLTNGLKDAFDAARAGGESDLLDRMFNGINIAGAGYGPVGSTLAGVKQTGAMHMRASSTFNTNLANGNYHALADNLFTLNYNRNNPGNSSLPVITDGNVKGAVLRYNNFPENFISANPQFSTIGLRTNLDNSIYHAMQTQFTLRPTSGFSYQGTFTWSKTLGSPPNGGFENPADRREYGLLFAHRTFDFRSNGGIELPIGPGRRLMGNSHGLLARIVEKWQTSMIFQMTSGRPNTIGAQGGLLEEGFGGGTGNPVITPEGVAAFGNFPTKFGHVDWPGGAKAGSYFPADTFVRVPDPQCAGVTSLQNLNAAGRCTLQALARPLPSGKTAAGQITLPDGRQGVIVLRNPLPGERGTLGLNTMEGPGLWFLDAAMSKSVKIAEGKTLQIRVDAKNVLNHPTPDDPGQASCFGLSTNLTLNNNNAFGSVGGKCVGESAARRFQATLRFNF